MRRNRLQAAAAAIVLVTLLDGVAGSTWSGYRRLQNATGSVAAFR